MPAKRCAGREAKPAGEIAVTDATAPRRPSSSAMAPPSELPATCGRSSPAPAKKRSAASASAGIPHGSPAGSGSDRPNPGRSTDQTSRAPRSRAVTGRHAAPLIPIPASSTSAGPSPSRR